ncbi:MAG TPA: PrsW family intramembrane metalloprotease [Ktedonobacteraceae bacterium]
MSHQSLHCGRSWVGTFFVGLALFVISLLAMHLTDNSNLYPTVILIGNFLVPVAFVAFLYDHRHFSTLSPFTLMISFAIGGVLGVVGASVLESFLVSQPSNPGQNLSLSSALLIGFIEEGCKIFAVILLAWWTPHNSELDGLLLGGAVGMGFAALESTGYAFTAFVNTGGQIDASIDTTILRGVLAPFGHGLWTAILGAILFRQCKPYRFRFTIPVLLTYLFVSVLHGLWDGMPYSISWIIPPGILISPMILFVSIIGLIVLAFIYRRSLAKQRQLIANRLIANRLIANRLMQ